MTGPASIGPLSIDRPVNTIDCFVNNPGQATPEAWVHAVIVGVFAGLLRVRLRTALQGSGRALLAVGIIATVFFVVNLVEALIPGLFPGWMRVEMIGIAALMATLAALILRNRR